MDYLSINSIRFEGCKKNSDSELTSKIYFLYDLVDG